MIPPDVWTVMLQNAPTVLVLVLIAVWQEKRLSECNKHMRDMLNRLLELVTENETSDTQ